MIDLRLGMKIYSNDWYLRHGLGPERAADLLHDMGVTFVITQSRFLPMADSAVKSAVGDDEARRYMTLDDVAFRRALRARSVDYFGVLNVCFDPYFLARYPEEIPIDQFGRAEEITDWYFGVPPTCDLNAAEKIELLARAVDVLDPDGLHLGFVRWPGFWETWLSDVNRVDMPDYCYAPATLRKFLDATNLDMSVDDPIAAAATIRRSHREAWRNWKCGETAKLIGRIRAAVQGKKPGLDIAINTLPFFRDEFDGAVEEVFGQDIKRLANVVDVFEVMAYHQILRQPASWPTKIATDIKARSGNRTICTLQSRPLYLDGMHAGLGRSETLDAEEFSNAVDMLEPSPVDGLCVFTFSDFLELRDTDDMKKIVQRLRRFRA